MKSLFLRPVAMAALAIGLAGCSSYDDYGYGYSGLSVGYGSYGRYATPYYGWYDGYYYPGTGYYIYDRGGTRYRWNDRYRSYWEARRPGGRYRDNWSGYRAERREDRREFREERREDRRDFRRDRREDRRDYRRDRRAGRR
ncbi:MAG TPA: hypothetical protein VEB68_09410 [Croceibacterium sp.]|nr:hypothetical protein [Croceibacterium sp.]